MKLQFLIYVLSILAYQKCNDTMALEEKSPFVIEEAIFSLISSGTKDGRSKLEIEVRLSPEQLLQEEQIQITGLYFRGQFIELQEVQPSTYKGGTYIKSQGTDEHDRGPEDSTETKNSDPKFGSWEQQLRANEGILCIYKKSKPKYYKIVLDKASLSSVPM